MLSPRVYSPRIFGPYPLQYPSVSCKNRLLFSCTKSRLQPPYLSNRVVLTIKEAININHKVHLTLYSSRIDLNLAIYHYFTATSRGHATGPERGQISTSAVTTRHDHRIEFSNLSQTCKQPSKRCWNKLQISIR